MDVDKEKRRKYLKKRKADAKLAYEALMKCYPLNLENLVDEIWQWIENYEGMYQISNYGRIKSFKRSTIKILKPYIDGMGYLNVDLLDHCKRKAGRIHVLVAKAFIPNPENKPTVNHIDGHPLNCFVENLEWATYSENTKHAYRIGLEVQAKGEDDSSTKLTNEQVREIRRIYIFGDKEYGIRPLAKKYSVGRTTIKRVLDGKSYRNVK